MQEDSEPRPDELKAQLADLRENLFLCHQDMDKLRVESIALKNFVQNLYESCEGMEDTELTLEEILSNLKVNIRKFAKEHNIRI